MRVMVVGWDGAEPRMISNLLSQGKLPNLNQLIQTGILKQLKSTIRPESSAAWTTFATGVNPGVHGVFAFTQHVPHSCRTMLTSADQVPVPFFWETLSQHNKRVAILNMPMAYPPRSVNGWFVCGLMTPNDSAIFTYPPELGKRLLDQGYTIDTEAPKAVDDRKEYATRMARQVRERTATALTLFKESEWDYGCVVYTELDRLQHFYWGDMDVGHPLHPRESLPAVIPDHYIELDRALGQLVSLADDDTTIIVMSDHGFGPCSRQFCVNQWLAQEGWLTYSNGPVLLNVARRLSMLLKQIPAARKLKQRLIGSRPTTTAIAKRAFYDQINWSMTRAWYSEASGIRINLRGREPQGIVTPGRDYDHVVGEIIALSKSLRDPLSQKLVFQGVYRRDELYQGPEIERAPDIILDTAVFSEDASQNHIPTAIPMSYGKQLFRSSFPYTGTHTGYGICATNRKPNRDVEGLADIPQWIMSLFHLDQTTSTPTLDHKVSPQGSYSEEDDRVIRQRLRDLGYID